MCKKPLAILSFGISVSLLLLGCTAQAETNNLQSLFFSEKCKGACWMGIEPQISTTSEAITILEKVYGDENVVLDSGTISWNAENPNWNNRGYVFNSSCYLGLNIHGSSAKVAVTTPKLSGAPHGQPNCSHFLPV